MSGNKHGGNEPAPGKGSSSFPALFLAFAVLPAFIAAGCATRAPGALYDPISSLEGDASMYAVIPAGSHRRLFELIAAKQKDGDALLRAIDRTDLVYGSVGQNGSFRILATGNFPRSGASLYFPSSKGWKKTGSRELGNWYTSLSMDAAVPGSGLVLLSSPGGMNAFLGGLKDPVPVSVPESFGSYVKHAREDGRIGIYLAHTEFLAAAIFGSDISLPVLYAEIFAAAPADQTADNGTSYLVSARIELQDARTARAMSALLRVATGSVARLDGQSVYIDSFPVPAEKLAELAGKLYFY